MSPNDLCVLQKDRKVVDMLTSQRREEVLVGSDVAERMNRVGCKMMKMMTISMMTSSMWFVLGGNFYHLKFNDVNLMGLVLACSDEKGC